MNSALKMEYKSVYQREICRKFWGKFFGKFGHIRGKKRQWLGNFSEQRDLHFFSVEKVILKLEGSMEPFFDFGL